MPTTTGTSTKMESLRDLHTSLSQKLHAKYKLGTSNQDSIYFQLWKNLQPYRDQTHSDKFRNMRCFSERTRERIDKLRWGKTWTKKAAFLQHRPYLPGQPIATDSRCPLPGCQGNDGAGHILLECTHADMKKQHIARHDAMMRMLIQEFTKGSKGSHYLIADVGTVETLKKIGVHSKRVPKFVLPDVHTQHTTRDIASCRNHSTRRMDQARNKMRQDMMIVEMTDTEQRTYLPHDTDTGSRLPNLQRTMPNGKARKVMIVEGGYCSDVSYLEKVKEKGQQHARLEEALRLYGYDVTSLTYICGCTGSQYHSSNDTIRMLGIEHLVAKKLRDKIHEHSIACADKLMKSRRMLERSSYRQNRKRSRADPP